MTFVEAALAIAVGIMLGKTGTVFIMAFLMKLQQGRAMKKLSRVAQDPAYAEKLTKDFEARFGSGGDG